MPSVPTGPTSATAEPAASAPAPVVSDLVRAIYGRLHVVVAVALVVAAAVMIGWMMWPEKYRAVALVALDPQAPRLVAEQTPNGVGDASTVISYAEVATSDGFLIPIAKEQRLVEDPEFGGGAIGDALLELRRNLRVSRRGLTYLIDVSFTSSDPEKAARVANAVAEEIVRRQQSLRREANSGISDALRSRLADLRAAVLASEKAVADYRQQNDLLDVSPDGRVGLKRLNSLTDQLGPIRARLEDARARYDKLRKVKSEEDADPSIFRSERLTELLSRLGDEKRQLASVTQTYGPRHPSVEAAQARIGSLETAIRSERARIVEQAKAEVDVLTEQNAAYEKEIAKRTSEQLATDQKEVVLQDLVRQAQADRQLYEQFLARQKTTQEQGDLSQPDAVVVSSASPPTRSTRPGLTMAGLVALVGGLGAGLLWAVFGPRPAAPPPRRAAAPIAPAAPTASVAPPPDVASASASLVQEPVAPPVPPAAETAPASHASATVAPLVADAPAVAPVASEEPAPSVVVPEAPPAPAPLVADPPHPAVPDVVAASPVTEVVPAVAAPSAPEATPAPEIASAPEVVSAPEVPRPVAAAAEASSDTPIDAAPVEPEAPPPAVAGEDAPRLSPRRHDPAQRLKRMLRTLTERDVPLVADLTRADPADAEAGLAAFVETIGAHLDKAPGLVLTVIGETAPVGVAEALADAVEARGHSAAVHRGDDPAVPSDRHDLVVEAVAAADTPPPLGVHPFALLVVETSRAAEERLAERIRQWESDPDRVVVAAFVPPTPAA